MKGDDEYLECNFLEPACNLVITTMGLNKPLLLHYIFLAFQLFQGANTPNYFYKSIM